MIQRVLIRSLVKKFKSILVSDDLGLEGSEKIGLWWKSENMVEN